MRILVITLLTTYILTECVGIRLIDIPSNKRHKMTQGNHKTHSNTKKTSNVIRRDGLAKGKFNPKEHILRTNFQDEEKDTNLKNKISTLVQQTLFDTERKIKSVQDLKDKNREQPPYRAGFILSMIKKTRDVLNELFNVAVKHRDAWKALEQLKIFELIVHTNVDTTNLVRQLVEIHVTHLNSTNARRVVLL